MINFRVAGDGHDMHAFEASPRDILRWEAAFPNASMMQFLSSYRVTELYQLAYTTLKHRNHEFVQAPKHGFISVREFMDSYDVYPGLAEAKTEGEESDPTQPVASLDQ